MPLSERHIEILQHALGLNKYGKCAAHDDPIQCRDHSSDTLPGHRNRFCAGGNDAVICGELVAIGLMVQHPTTEWLPYFNCSVTDAGRKAVRELSLAPPKLTRSQQRWRRFINSGASESMSFREFLSYERAPQEWM